MPLSVGTRLGAYEVTSPLGAGGMGEVYKARDTRLDRTVAIKVLPSHLADHAELRQRFEQEARAVSSLNHPNICTLHDIGTDDGTDFIVMEYVEGETLADRLERGAIRWVQAVAYARELADALDKAHRAGVVHRDVKPGNIIVTPSGTKLLDFGLAKLHGTTESEPDLSAVTEAKPLTEKGAILGTFQYMSPEQLEGKEVDTRADIFALGAVIYEMVTGEKAFKGETQASLIAAIMSGTPRAVSETAKLSPKALDCIVSVCLEKDPNRRWQSAADLERNLEFVTPDADSASAPPQKPSWTRLALVFAAGLAAAAIGTSWVRKADPPTPQHFQIAIGPNEGNSPGPSAFVAISPDGSALVYTAVRDGVSRLYRRRFDEAEAHIIPGSEDAVMPSFSPDGEWVHFNARAMGRTIERVSLQGGSSQTLASSGLPGGATGLADGSIVFATGATLERVRGSGGDPDTLLRARAGTGLLYHPRSLPDGASVLFTDFTPESTNTDVLAIETGTRRSAITDAASATYVPTGHIAFVRDGAIWAVPFDAVRREVRGQPRRILTGVEDRGWASFSVSDTGTLAYVPGEPGGWSDESLSWVDDDGRRTHAASPRHDYQQPRFSPSGQKVAVWTAEISTRSNVFVLDLDTDRFEQVTFGTGQDRSPVWMPDGQSIVFASDRGSETMNLYRQVVDGSGDAELLLESEEILEPTDVSPGRPRPHLSSGTRSPFLVARGWRRHCVSRRRGDGTNGCVLTGRPVRDLRLERDGR